MKAVFDVVIEATFSVMASAAGPSLSRRSSRYFEGSTVMW